MMGSGKQTREYKKIQDNYARLCSTLTEQVSPGDLGNKLFQENLIGGDLKRAANKELTDEAVRVNKLLSAVHNQIDLNSENFYKFIKILKEYKQLGELMILLQCKWTQYRPRAHDDTILYCALSIDIS